MAISPLCNPNLERSELKRVQNSRIATIVLLGITAIASVIVAGWFAGEGKITGIFTQVQLLQDNPPFWLEAPMLIGKYLIATTVLLFVLVLAITKVSTQPRQWSRRLIVGILLILTARYVLWRSLSTLNITDPLNGVFSIGLFVLELLTLFSSTIGLLLMLNVNNRNREADSLSTAVIDGSFAPKVDIFVPTYNEPNFILRRTIIGCQALDYPHKTTYLLDDTRRPEVKELAEELGCEYLTRIDNSYAKAGNLNNALHHTDGELLVVFDADFVPTKNFLTRTDVYSLDPDDLKPLSKG